MGFYIECRVLHGKAKEIMQEYDAVEISVDEAESVFLEKKNGAVICVVDNGPFEAAAYCYSLNEFKAFSRSEDNRPKTWLLANKVDRVMAMSGYTGTVFPHSGD